MLHVFIIFIIIIMALTEGDKRKKFFRNPFKSSKKKDGVLAPLTTQTPDRGPPKKLMLETPGAVSAMTTNTDAKRSGLLPGMTDEATGSIIFEDINSPNAQTTKTASMSHLRLQSNTKRASSKSYLSKSKWFQKMSAAAFDVVDQDGSGCVDEKELYSGLLLIHLKLGSYAGPAACKVRSTIPSSSTSFHRLPWILYSPSIEYAFTLSFTLWMLIILVRWTERSLLK